VRRLAFTPFELGYIRGLNESDMRHNEHLLANVQVVGEDVLGPIREAVIVNRQIEAKFAAREAWVVGGAGLKL
jgi:hypothetical protein